MGEWETEDGELILDVWEFETTKRERLVPMGKILASTTVFIFEGAWPVDELTIYFVCKCSNRSRGPLPDERLDNDRRGSISTIGGFADVLRCSSSMFTEPGGLRSLSRIATLSFFINHASFMTTSWPSLMSFFFSGSSWGRAIHPNSVHKPLVASIRSSMLKKSYQRERRKTGRHQFSSAGSGDGSSPVSSHEMYAEWTRRWRRAT